MPKRNKKSGGKAPKRPPPNPAPASSSDEENDTAELRALVARVEALEKEKAMRDAGLGDGGSTSGAPPPSRKSTRKGRGAKLMEILSSRLTALEKPVERHAPPGPPVVQVQASDPEEQQHSQGASCQAVPMPSTGGAFPSAGTGGAAGARSDAPLALDPWLCRAQHVIWSALAPSTRHSYQSKAREFEAFRAALALPQVWPIPPEHLMRFLLYLHSINVACRSLSVYLAALAFCAKASGFADATADFRVRKLVEGLKRICPPMPDRRKPITPGILVRLINRFEVLCSTPYESLLFRTISIIMFFGAFRPSEVLYASAGDESGRALQLQDVLIKADGVIITLRRSKTDQRGVGFKVRLGLAQNLALCPVRTLRSYLAARPAVRGALFCHVDASPVTFFQFRVLFRRAVADLGFRAEDYGLHSFRIGAASAAADLGLPARDIQRIGRWRSWAFKYYVREPDER
ncbi:uncharacterized protein [Tiliqua scincoides]|uniref:uncharacterized protein n=1 Tax=Tiliqua scincoides TaxID=71010 RepID=UPI0034632574